MPVRVLVAVTVTPGSGMLPDLIMPWSVPPAMVAAGDAPAGRVAATVAEAALDAGAELAGGVDGLTWAEADFAAPGKTAATPRYAIAGKQAWTTALLINLKPVAGLP